MHFETYVYERHDKMLAVSIKDVMPVVLRFVCRGRNAWYGTWVRQYFDGCFFDTFESAKDYAERNRGPGNVFYVEEIPSLAFVGDNFCGVVAQINVSLPFADYLVSVEDRPAVLSDETYGRAPEIPAARMGSSIVQVLSSFDVDSGHWRRRQPRRNSLVLVWQRLECLSLEVLTEAPLDEFVSEAQGVNYYLHWRRRDASATHENVLVLAEELYSAIHSFSTV